MDRSVYASQRLEGWSLQLVRPALHPEDKIPPNNLLSMPRLPVPGKPFVSKPVSSATDAGTQQIYAHNATHSPLLRLPPDIRHLIFKTLLGSRLIHLRLRGDSISQDGWRHVVCAQPASMPDGHYPSYSELQARRYSNDEWEPAHQECKYSTYYEADPHSRTYLEHERMPLAVLRTSRQVYFEANHVLWSTNTFSLHDSHAVLHFLRNRSPLQLSLMTRLRLRFDLRDKDLVTRRRALSEDFYAEMKGVRRLSLVVQDLVDDRLLALRHMTELSTGTHVMDGSYIGADLYELSNLCLRNLQLAVIPPLPNDEDKLAWRETQMSAAAAEWRAEHARRIRAFLLRAWNRNADGAES